MNDQDLSFVIKARDEASRVLHGVGNELHNTGSTWSQLAGIAKGFGIIAAAAFTAVLVGAGTLLGVLKHCLTVFTDYAGSIEKIQRMTGMTAKATSDYVGILKLLGISADKGSTAVKFLAKNLYGAFTGSKPMIAAFKELGVTFKTGNGHMKSMSEFLWQVQAAFDKLPAGAMKTALAVKLFGRGGTDLMKFLSQSPKQMAGFLKFLKATGMEMGPKALEAFKKYEMSTHKIGIAFQGLEISVGKALMPLLNKYMPQLTTWFVKESPKIRQGLRHGIGWIIDNMPAVIKWVRGLWPQLVTVWKALGPIIHYGRIVYDVIHAWRKVSPDIASLDVMMLKLCSTFGAVASIAVSVWHTVTNAFGRGVKTFLRFAADLIGAVRTVRKAITPGTIGGVVGRAVEKIVGGEGLPGEAPQRGSTPAIGARVTEALALDPLDGGVLNALETFVGVPVPRLRVAAETVNLFRGLPVQRAMAAIKFVGGLSPMGDIPENERSAMKGAQVAPNRRGGMMIDAPYSRGQVWRPGGRRALPGGAPRAGLHLPGTSGSVTAPPTVAGMVELDIMIDKSTRLARVLVPYKSTSRGLVTSDIHLELPAS